MTRKAYKGETALLDNLPQGDEFFVNTRGEVMHVRTYVPPEDQEIKALVFFIHGYGGHCNTTPKVRYGKALPPAGFACIQLDLAGHGYSEGERAYIEKYRHWVDDLRQLLEAVTAGGFRDPSKAKLHISPAHLQRLKKAPFFLSGESLGGGLSILLALTLKDSKSPLLARFKGAALIAPAIQGNPPPAPVVAVLRYLVTPLIPRCQIPDMLESVKIPEKVWKSPEHRASVCRDEWGKPGGISWGLNMKFRMGLNMLDMVSVVYRRLRDVDFPFLIMHDPDDAIVQFGPSKELMEKASTPTDDPRARELKEMNDWLHDLLTNCTDLVITQVIDWIQYQTERASG